MQYTKPTSEVCEVNTLHTFLNTEKKRKCIYFSSAVRIHCNTIHLNINQFLSTQSSLWVFTLGLVWQPPQLLLHRDLKARRNQYDHIIQFLTSHQAKELYRTICVSSPLTWSWTKWPSFRKPSKWFKESQGWRKPHFLSKSFQCELVSNID